MTAYCIKVLDADPGLVTIVYSLCSITAPIPGAAMGGYLADKNVKDQNNVEIGWIQREKRADSYKVVYWIRSFGFHLCSSDWLLEQSCIHYAFAMVPSVLWCSSNPNCNGSRR
jgi:hypothetical protein